MLECSSAQAVLRPGLRTAACLSDVSNLAATKARRIPAIFDACVFFNLRPAMILAALVPLFIPQPLTATAHVCGTPAVTHWPTRPQHEVATSLLGPSLFSTPSGTPNSRQLGSRIPARLRPASVDRKARAKSTRARQSSQPTRKSISAGPPLAR